MANSDQTRPSLLVRIRDHHDDEAWNEFAQIYAPLVYSYARRQGLQDADAVAVAQDVLITVARKIGDFQYDRAEGTFRGWIKTVARSRLCDLVDSQRRYVRGSGDTGVQKSIDAVQALGHDDTGWETEYRRSAFNWAVKKIRADFRDATWAAFWQTAAEGRSPKEVAKSLKMSVGAVYIARSRVLSSIRQVVQDYED